MGISNVLTLLGGVALFLFGMTLMGDSLKKVAGNKLELVLYRLSSTPVKGILLGTGVTAVIQSSSATSVMVVGFVNSGMMKVKQAIGVVMGAIIGTSITGWIIAISAVGSKAGNDVWDIFSTDTLTAIIAIVGIILRIFCKSTTKHNVGDIMLGFAVLMFGIAAMSNAVYPLRESESFINLLTRFSNPVVGILVGLLFTSILQSASAAVGIVQTLSVTGAIKFDMVLPLIMGIAIGAAVPVLLSALGANVNGKRTALVYLLVDTLGVILFSILFYTANAFVSFSFMGMALNAIQIALLNTIFRAVIVILQAPAISLLEKLVCWLVPEKEDENAEDLRDMDRLEERFIAHPALAIEQSRLVINHMAQKTQKALKASFHLLEVFTENEMQYVARTEDIVDRYEDKLGTYLVKITRKELTHQQNAAVSKFLHAINDFERMSDHAINVSQSAEEIHVKNIEFSADAKHEIRVLSSAVAECIGLAVDAFTSGDLEIAYKIEPLEELIDNLCDEMKLRHIDRIAAGECTLQHGFVFNNLLTDLERISDHCSNIGVAMIELGSETFDVHEYLHSIKSVKDERFEAYYDEYSKRYNI